MAREERKIPRDGMPMPADTLTKKVGRFALTAAVAKRAARLIARYGRSPDGASGTVEQALLDIASGRVRMMRKSTVTEEEASETAPSKQGRTRKAA